MSSYRVQKTVLAAEERSLYHALTLVVAQRALLLSKVKLSAIIEPAQQHRNVGTATFLNRYTVDFVICERTTTHPLCVILVDGPERTSHPSGTAAAQIEQICAAAALPVVRIAQAKAYRMDQLLRLIDPLLAGGSSSSARERDDRAPLPARDETGKTIPGKAIPPLPRSTTIFSPN